MGAVGTLAGSPAIVIRAAIMSLVLLPTLASAQAVVDPADKVTNDRPDRPLQMPPASSETREAFDDFERFSRRGAWERATKALYAIPEAQAARFVDGKDGFIIPVARKRREVLAGLPAEGQAAYRLFYDTEAKTLLDQAEGPAERATLERLFSAYFLTSIGDNAADRLGDLCFELGQFDRAADCWLAILRERPDSELSPALIGVKAALALAKAGRSSEALAVRDDLKARHADEVVALGGRKAKAAEHLREIGQATPTPSTAASATYGPPPPLGTPISPAWQVKIGASITAGMTAAELSQWEGASLSNAVPVVAVEGKALFANYLGHVFAVDLASGKMLWRSSSFHNVDVGAMPGQPSMVEPKKFAIVAAPGFVWTVGRDPKDANMQATSRLVCRRAEGGDIVWQSTDLADYAGVEFLGTPLLVRGTLYLAGKSGAMGGGMMMNGGMVMMGGGGQPDNSPHQVILAVRPHDGRILWKADIGTFRESSQRFSYYGMPDATAPPRLTYRAGAIYVDTHAGVLVRLNAESGSVDWGYGYPTDPVQPGNSRGFIIFFNGMSNMQVQSQTTPEPPLLAGEALLIKGAKSDRVCAIDPDRMAVLWDRPIAKSARLLGLDDRTIYLGGPELGALDRTTRALRWSTPLPGGSEEGRPIVRPDGIWQLTNRGIFEVDPATGGVRRIFRGDDPGATGGDLILSGRWLLAISNRTISAYPRGGAVADVPSAGTTRTGGGG